MRALVIVLILLSGATAKAQDAEPRTVLALHAPQQNTYSSSRLSAIHSVVEMPLNHLGLRVQYHDINHALPDISEIPELRGVLVWLENPHDREGQQLLDWLHQALDAGLKLVIIGDLRLNTAPGSLEFLKERSLFQRLGLDRDGSWVRYTYDVGFQRHKPEWLDFERRIDGLLKSYPHMVVNDRSAVVILSATSRERQRSSVLISTHKDGGYIAGGYLYYQAEKSDFKQYYLDPFYFFREAFSVGLQPIPDTTTINGLRIFYSHIDGDGWNNITQIEEFRHRNIISSQVILEKVISAYPDLPVTVAPIAADLDPEWSGSLGAIAVARGIFNLNHVEAGSHTYSHPLDWSFFNEYHPNKEAVYFSRFPRREWMLQQAGFDSGKRIREDSISNLYKIPRSFAAQPFDLDKEISGSIAFINGLLPPKKRVEIVQWSGDTTPFSEAIKVVRQLGLRNINGGDSRFDPEYPSYAWVAPVAWNNQGQWQIYASNSNENTYTDVWKDRHFAFKYLKQTLENTEVPYRIKPINVYYHMYSGERLASLRAVQRNLDYARSQPVSPITASHFAGIVDGFIQVRLVQVGALRWKIENRDRLNTLRFDHASDYCVDFQRSRGIIGQRHQYGVLYVAMDPNVAEPVVAIRQKKTLLHQPAEQPYLLLSRHAVKHVSHGESQINYLAEGFGDGKQVWVMPSRGRYRVQVRHSTGNILLDSLIDTDETHQLQLMLPASDSAIQVSISFASKGRQDG